MYCKKVHFRSHLRKKQPVYRLCPFKSKLRHNFFPAVTTDLFVAFEKYFDFTTYNRSYLKLDGTTYVYWHFFAQIMSSCGSFLNDVRKFRTFLDPLIHTHVSL